MQGDDRVTAHPPGNAVPAHPPARVYVDLTNACPMKCRHCYNSSGSALDGELSDGEILALIDHVSDMGVPDLIFSGGEPMMRSGFLDLAVHARRRGLVLTVMTTGAFVTEEYARVLADLQVRVKISLDGATRRTHDALRGPGAFAAALHGIRLLRSAGNRAVVVHYSVHRENLPELPELPALLSRLGVRELAVGFTKPAGRAKDNASLLVPPSMAADGWQAITALSRSAQISVLSHTGAVTRRFGCPDDKFGVTSDGRVTPCVFLGHGALEGTIREHPLEVLWRRHLARGEVFHLNDRCARCPHLAVSGGGCRARALYYTGDINAPDPMCCAFYANQVSPARSLAASRRDAPVESDGTGIAAFHRQMDRREFLRSSEAAIATFALLGLGLSGCSTCGDLCSNTCREDCAGRCTSTCGGTCSGICGGSCTATCADDCVGGCTAMCMASCGSTCSGTCLGTCSGTCG